MSRPRLTSTLVTLCALAMAETPSRAETPTDPARVITLALGGDVALPTGPNDAALEALGPRVFDRLAPLLGAADLAFANLEAPLTTRAPVLVKTFPMTQPPARLAWMLAAGLDLFSLANNHMGDAGLGGIDDTVAALTAARDARPARDLWWAGAAADPRRARDGLVFTPPGKQSRVAFLALGNGTAPGVAHFATTADAADALRRVRELAATSDIVIVSLHGGSEYSHAPDPALAAFSRRLVDAGADLVAVTHAHVVRGFERRGDALICHGLGNLAFATRTERAREHGVTLWGVLPIVTFEDGRLTRVRLIPLQADNAYPQLAPPDSAGNTPEPAPQAGFVPYPLAGPHAEAALDAFERFSQGLGAPPLTFTRKGDEAELVY